MKNSIYFLMLLVGLVFTGCEPMEDIHEDVDAELEARPNVGNESLILTEEDYENLGFDRSYFVSVEEANDSLPDYLSELYPVLGEGSIANVTAEIAEPVDYSLSKTEYEVTKEDYTAVGSKYGNFDNLADVYNLIDYKFPGAEAGTIIELTYIWYSGSASEVTSEFLKVNEDTWTEVLYLESEDYQEMGEAFSNFDSRTEAMNKIPVYLNQLNPYAAADESQDVLFKVYLGGGESASYLQTFTYDGVRWQGSFERTLQFGYSGTQWEPDNTILYTMDAADFELVGEELEEKYVDPAWSAGNYANFDRREGNRNYWSDEMLLEAVNIVLNNNVAPNAEEGQKYVVYFAIYNGSSGVESLNVIKQDGKWVLNQ